MLPAQIRRLPAQTVAAAHPIYDQRTHQTVTVSDWLREDPAEELPLRLQALVEALRHPGVRCDAHHADCLIEVLIHPDQRCRALGQLHRALPALEQLHPALDTHDARRLTGDRKPTHPTGPTGPERTT